MIIPQASISIVIPLYNKENFISTTIDSIIYQNYKNYEVVVVDDGSTDGSANVVERYAFEKITLIKKKNGGASSARNLGVKEAKGDWIVFLDADDLFEPNALNVFNQLINSHPRCDFFCCNHYDNWNGYKRIFSKRLRNGYLWNNFLAWSTGMCLPIAGAALIRRSFALCFPQDEKLKRYEDAESLFNMMRHTRIYSCPIPVMTYCHDNSLASHRCANIKDDFLGHLDLKGKSMWEQYSLSELYKEAVRLYPDQIDYTYIKHDFRTIKVIVARKIIKVMKALRAI